MKPAIRQVPRMDGLQNENGPAEAATSPSHGSINPQQDTKMNSTDDSTGPAIAPDPSAIRGIGIRAFELISLLETIAEKSSEIAGTADAVRHVQDLSSIAVTFAQQIEKGLHELNYPGDAA